MSRAVLYILFGLLLSAGARSQSLTSTEISSYSYYPANTDKESWQRLNLLLSSTFIVVAREGQIEHDTCLNIASRSLGMSRLPVLAEGFADKELMEQSQWIDRQEPATGIRLLSRATGQRKLQLQLLLGSYYAFQPSSYYRHRDSVEYFLHKAIEESKVLKEEKLGRIALCLLGKIYVQANDRKGDSIFTLLINQCRKAKDKETEARAFAYRGTYMAPTQATFLQKVTDLQTASALYHSLGDTENEINVLTNLGYMMVVTQQLPAAHGIFLKALALADAIQYPYTHYNAEAISMVTYFQGKFGDPLRYTQQAIKTAESCRDSIGWGYFYSRLSTLYDSEGRVNESYKMARKAVNRFVKDRNTAVYTILITVVNQMYDEGNGADALNFIGEIEKKVTVPTTSAELFAYHDVLTGCYLNLNMPDLAEMHIQKMDSLETEAEAVRGPLRRTVISDLLGFVSFQRGNYKQAKRYFEKHFTTPSHGNSSLSSDLHTYRWIIKTDSVLGDYESAVSNYKKYTALLDSNFKVTKIRQAEELQVLYETKEKEDQIAQLHQQAKQRRLVNHLTFAGIGAVVIIAVLLYRQNRLRQKSNKIITQKNGQLQDLVADKEWLLKEVHHRVKNNLQIIMSLLNSQSKYVSNDLALTAINDSERRVQAISLIHQKLYQSENTSSVDMRQYIDELISYLQESFDSGNQVVIEQDIEPVRLDVAKAIPLGLILNEAVVNAIKYAFPGQQKGIIRISLKHNESDQLLLKISDNGVGVSLDVQGSRQDSLGFNLMRGLTRQLDGIFSIESKDGLDISIRFSPLTNQANE